MEQPAGQQPDLAEDHVQRLIELMKADQYTPAELAQLLNIEPYVIEQLALEGTLRSTIFRHHVITIQRDDALRWLEARHGRTSE